MHTNPEMADYGSVFAIPDGVICHTNTTLTSVVSCIQRQGYQLRQVESKQSRNISCLFDRMYVYNLLNFLALYV